MEAVGVDPRDTRWEVSDPTYRVYFWEPSGGACDEYELRGATDTFQVIEWTQRLPRDHPHLSGWTLDVWVSYTDRIDGPGLIRLVGGGPNR